MKLRTIAFAALTFTLWLTSISIIGPLLNKAEAQEPPTVSISDVSLHPGETMVLSLMLSSAPAGLSGFDIDVEAEGDAAEIIGADTDFGLQYIKITTSTAVRIFAADINNTVAPGATSIELATVTIRALRTGTSPLTIVVQLLEDEKSFTIDHVVLDSLITVSMPIISGQTKPVADLDGDGLAEDLNGNNRLDFQDIILLFENLETILPSDVALFDFDGNGQLGFNDVLTMFELFWRTD